MTAAALWILILLLAAGVFMIRFSFIGFLGDRSLPAWVMRLLRYVPVAVLPALVAPQVVWPAATGGALDAPRIVAALAALAVGAASRNLIAAILGGMATLYLMLWLAG